MGQILPAHQYIWRDYSLPGYKGVVLTLGIVPSIIVFAFFASLLAVVQTKAWIAMRYLGLRGIRLNDYEERMSQFDAFKALFGRRNHQNDQSMSTRPKRLGILAVFNTAAFFFGGIFIPLYLTGYLSTPVVLSKSMDTCIGYEDRLASSRFTAQLADSYFKQCLLSPLDVLACSEESGIVGSTPQIHIGRDEECPFSGDVCQDGVKPVRVEYVGLSPRDYGVNLGNQILVDHRVICAPLKTEPFLLIRQIPNKDTGAWENRTAIWFGRKYHDSTFNTSNDGALYGTFLATLNGPNRYSGEYSGNYLASLSRPQPPYELSVYPLGSPTNPTESIHPNLRRDDGSVFVVMFRAGRSLYTGPMDDPFYAAHNKDINLNMYVPDYEATALGCVEQYRLCWNAENSFCTNWGGDVIMDMLMRLVRSVYQINYKGGLEMMDLPFVYLFFTSMASVGRYFQIRTGTQLLITSIFRQGEGSQGFIYQEEQWISEVQAWFTTAFLNARYTLLQIVRRDGLERAEDAPKPMLKLCHSVLFQNNGYKNIDFIGLLVTTSALLLIYIASLIPKWSGTLAKACRNVKALILKVWAIFKFYEPLYFLKYLSESSFFRSQSRARAPRPWSAFWNGNTEGLSSGNEPIDLGDIEERS
jgi:hypothetical protein